MSEQNTPSSLPPSALVMQLISGFQMSQAAYVIADTGVATILEQEGPQTVADLAARTGTHEQALGRLIRTLAPVGLFTTEGKRCG
ncbi:methyltransferase dimerization domain-containing protein [Streptomyces sp. M19]